MKTELTAKHLKGIVSHNYFRPAMMGVKYEPQNNRIVATNGYVLGVFDVIPSEGDVECILPLEAFDYKGLVSKNGTVEIKTNGKIEVIGDIGRKTLEPINETYPDWECVWPKDPNNATATISFDLDLVDCIRNAIPSKEKKVTLAFNGERQACVVTPIDPDAGCKFLLMPYFIKK